jgi:NADPH2:quinone reductase
MKAFVLTADGPRISTREEPCVRSNEVLIRVRACALNRVDLAMMNGAMHGATGGVGTVLGIECAGDVVDVGAAVGELKPGDRVMCGGAGAFAEYRAADSLCVLPIPDGMSYEQAATFPIALQTMHDAVVTQAQVGPDSTLLVQGATSGVGLMAMQIAKVMGARWVAGSSTHDTRRQRLHEFGADLAFDSRDPAWVGQVLEATGGKGVDALIDQVSGPLVNQSMQATRVQGRIVNVGRLGGMQGNFDFDLHALRRLTYVGVTFRTRSLEEVREVVRRLRVDLWPALVAGRLKLPIDRVFEFDATADALEHMAGNRHFGKIVLRVG